MIDLFLLSVAAITALALRENMTLYADSLRAIVPYLAVSTVVAVPASLVLGLDRALWRYSALSDFIKVVTWISVTVVVSTVAVFLINRMEGVSRSFPILHELVAACLLVGARVAVRARFLSRSRRPDPARIVRPGAAARDDCVLIVGVNDLTWLFLRALGALDQDNVRVAGVVATTHLPKRQTVRGHLIYGPDESLPTIIQTLEVHGVRVQRIIVTIDPATLPPAMAADLGAIAVRGAIRVETLFDLIGLRSAGSRPTALEPASPDAALADAPAEPATPPRKLDSDAVVSRPYWRMKRAGDLLAAAFLLMVLAPLFLAVSCGVVLNIGRPLLFWQDRPGRGGRRFRLYKFRTMGPAYASDGRPIADPKRLNWLGRFLRATRIDELPQLWNILKGDMSFVGPRPLLVIDQVEGETARLLVRPGLTGWAQVMGGRTLSASDKMALDTWYVHHASLALDLRILARTVPILFGGEWITSEAVRAWEIAAGIVPSRGDVQLPKSESARAAMQGLSDSVHSVGR